MGKHGYNHGDLGWTELNSTDAGGAMDFYSQLAGWENKGEPMPGYHVFGKGEEMLGGVQNLGDGDTTPRWMPYITVSDLDAALSKAKQLGASQLGDTVELPDDAGRIAVIRDPQGLLTGLAQYPPMETG